MPLEFKELLYRSLEKNPEKRFSITDFMNNSWVSSGSIVSSPRGKAKKVVSIESLLKNISHEYRVANNIEKMPISNSSEVELIVAHRVNRTLVEELNKLLSYHIKLRKKLQERIKNENSLLSLLAYLDYKYLHFIWELPLKIGKETASQTIKCKELEGVEFPEPLSNIIPEVDLTGNVILNFLQKKSDRNNK